MQEAEVILRIAFWLLEQSAERTHADIAIDGAHVLVMDRCIFDIQGFLAEHECVPVRVQGWYGDYLMKDRSLSIKSKAGFDVQVRLGDRHIRVECKGKGQASTRFDSAIGQVVTGASVGPGEELWVAVPDTPSFDKRASRIISNSPLLAKLGIRIALVGRSGVRLLPQLSGL